MPELLVGGGGACRDGGRTGSSPLDPNSYDPSNNPNQQGHKPRVLCTLTLARTGGSNVSTCIVRPHPRRPTPGKDTVIQMHVTLTVADANVHVDVDRLPITRKKETEKKKNM